MFCVIFVFNAHRAIILFSRFVRFLPSLTNWEIFFDLYEVFLRFFKKFFRPPFRNKKSPYHITKM